MECEDTFDPGDQVGAVTVIGPVGFKGLQVAFPRHRVEIPVFEPGQLLSELLRGLDLVVAETIEHSPVGRGGADEPAFGR